ncbi:hypothetical protein LIER_36138 [Lithospermum erythrorhizon]|uniref:MULE transposase domain-containing protein n=1 Tax=Lithospermum erythrorhizon TaxID=34254 RepID=A0AAV3P6B8_LITER
MDAEDFDIRNIDEYAMRTGCPIGCKALYAYTVVGRGFGRLKPLLYREIRAENIAVQQKEAEEIGEMASHLGFFVEKENYETWRWFIEGLIGDLKIRNQEKYVIISYKQKGLKQVVHDSLPGAARRNCVQHIYMNLKKTHGRGDYLRDRLWEIVKSTNKANFKRAMKKLKDFNENAHSWMIDHVEVRDKPLITMLELIRSKVMEMIKDRLAAMSKKLGLLCVKIKKILDDNVKDCVRGHNIRRCPAKQSGQQAKKPTKQEKGKGKKSVKQSKRRAKAKRGETSGAADDIEEAVDPAVGATDPVQQHAPNVVASEETEDPFVERRRKRATRRGRGFAKVKHKSEQAKKKRHKS